MSGYTVDLFSNAAFPFTLTASLAVIAGFFHLSGFQLDEGRDRIRLPRVGIPEIPVFALIALFLGFFAFTGFATLFHLSVALGTGTHCLVSLASSILFTKLAVGSDPASPRTTSIKIHQKDI